MCTVPMQCVTVALTGSELVLSASLLDAGCRYVRATRSDLLHGLAVALLVSYVV